MQADHVCERCNGAQEGERMSELKDKARKGALSALALVAVARQMESNDPKARPVAPGSWDEALDTAAADAMDTLSVVRAAQ
jgi:hypothetical protein